jgi:preprotein translocase subunit SecG
LGLRERRREVWAMRILFHVLLIIVSLGLIAVVLLQKGKSAGLSGAITGGAEHLFGKQKARGLDLFLSRLTTGLAVAFIILSLVVSYIVKE